MSLAAKDSSELFSTISGVLALHDINILFAECFLWRDGTVVDIFTVTDLPEFLAPDETWRRVGYSVRAALTGKLSLEYRLSEKRRSPMAKRSLEVEPEVRVDNAASDFYTLIEVKAADRIGLLYDVSRAMLELDLVVHLSKIATYGDLVQDVFYVRDVLGEKVEGRERIARIEAEIGGNLSAS
jgi:[protein-PII] uridylyltransferase